MARVTAAQLFANLRIDAPQNPARSVVTCTARWLGASRCITNGAPAGNHRPRLHPEKILQSRFDPGRLACSPNDAHAASAGDRHEFGAILSSNRCCSAFKRWRSASINPPSLAAARNSAKLFNPSHNATSDSRTASSSSAGVEDSGKVFATNSTRARKLATASGSTNFCKPAASAASARTRALPSSHSGRSVFADRQLVIHHPLDHLHALRLRVPFRLGRIAQLIGEEIDQPFRSIRLAMRTMRALA